MPNIIDPVTEPSVLREPSFCMDELDFDALSSPLLQLQGKVDKKPQTAAIILAMQSNLVISLGMVGALSIVRFRTAIKDPMDLVFLFWSISIGIICGAGLYEVALLTCLVVTILILVLENLPASRAPMMLVVNVTDVDKEDAVLDIVKKYSNYYKVKSRNLTAGTLDMVVEVRVKEESAFVKEVSAVDTVLSASLIAHDGEVTF